MLSFRINTCERANLNGFYKEEQQQRLRLLRFMEVMSICHTVVAERVVDETTGELTETRYNAESPDEGALVKAAARLGFTFVNNRDGVSVVDVDRDLLDRVKMQEEDHDDGEHSAPVVRFRYRILALNEFSSARKRMSVLVQPIGRSISEYGRDGDDQIGSSRLHLAPSARETKSCQENENDDSTGGAFLFCKGADTVMFERSTWNAGPLGSHTNSMDEHASNDVKTGSNKMFNMEKVLRNGGRDAVKLDSDLRRFALDGLRTLVIGCRYLSPSEVSHFLEGYERAARAVNGRKEALAEVANSVERGMTLLGATAIEDRLQGGVPDTIHDLLLAGIKLWVLTGDKEETAISIGFASRLLSKDVTLLHVNADDEFGALLQLNDAARQVGLPLDSSYSNSTEAMNNEKETGNQQVNHKKTTDSAVSNGAFALIVTGRALSHITRSSKRRDAALGPPGTRSSVASLASLASFQSYKSSESFPRNLLSGHHKRRNREAISDDALRLLDIAQRCRVVVACRVSPSQKALLVRLVKKNVVPRPVTLAIGDGANDVTMIQEAHVGVGISGKEGLQVLRGLENFAPLCLKYHIHLCFRWSCISRS